MEKWYVKALNKHIKNNKYIILASKILSLYQRKDGKGLKKQKIRRRDQKEQGLLRRSIIRDFLHLSSSEICD
jgi:hypothetical protein